MYPAIAAVGKVIKKIPYQVWLLIGFGLIFWCYGNYQFKAGKAEVQTKWDAAVERGKVIVDKLKEQQLVIRTETKIEYVDRVKTIREKGKTIYEQVPVYIPVDTPDLPYGVRVLHDAAALSSPIAAGPGANGPAIGVRDFTATVVRNYEACHVTAARLTSLQSFVLRQHEAALELCKSEEVSCSTDK